MNSKKVILFQLSLSIIFLIIIAILVNNLLVNLIRTNMLFSISWLFEPSGFAISESSLQFKPSDSYFWALFNGWVNSLKVIFSGLILATLIGFSAGLSRFSKNILLRRLASFYILIVRQIPLLIQLLFWYFVGFLSLSDRAFSPIGSIVNISNQGIRIMGVTLSAEFSSLLLGLSIFTGASIAEVVRGAINSVSRGQWEAFRSLGINESIGIRKIILRQSLPAIIPGLTSQYLNLAKNSTLAIAIGYADLYAVSDTAITQTGRSVEGFLILLISFLALNLIITSSMEVANRIFVKSR